ncbi:FecR family protein [uncultured Polaribacter sp.]|uniref:FecR family protein n=1 Tax=uncultured Polaribacter sp. TaxID=174711 RepID=UPI00262807CC|nr:FecR family protein [uncultured Polaribacter sp.]
MEKIIIKYLTDKISLEELKILRAWLKDNKNKASFKEFVRINQQLDTAYSNVNAEEAYQKIINKTKEREKPVKRVYQTFFKYAAAILILFSVGYFYQQGYFKTNNTLIIPNENVTLQLENGDVKVISEQINSPIVNKNGAVVGNQKGNVIAYNGTNEIQELSYNTITVPYGKRFELFLSDGTHVYLNAGSTFKYPVKFLPDMERKVFLNGEGFFDVTKNKKNAFIVNAEELNIRVFGTQFNVSTYPEDVSTDVVLVEGLVGLDKIHTTYDVNKQKKGKMTISHMLEPSFKGIYNKQSKIINQEKVNTYNYTSWIEGKLIFKNTSFKNMLKKMERHYNVTIVNNNPNLNEEIYNANFGDISVYEVLEGLHASYGVEYTIEQNKIFIN